MSGDGVAIRLTNNATVRSARCHIPLYVGICVQPYCGQHRWAGRHKTSDRPRKQKPRVSGALTGATEGLGGRGRPAVIRATTAPRSRSHRKPKSGARGVPAIPQRRSPRTPPSPGPHQYVREHSFRKMAKGCQETKSSAAANRDFTISDRVRLHCPSLFVQAIDGYSRCRCLPRNSRRICPSP